MDERQLLDEIRADRIMAAAGLIDEDLDDDLRRFVAWMAGWGRQTCDQLERLIDLARERGRREPNRSTVEADAAHVDVIADDVHYCLDTQDFGGSVHIVCSVPL